MKDIQIYLRIIFYTFLESIALLKATVPTSIRSESRNSISLTSFYIAGSLEKGVRHILYWCNINMNLYCLIHILQINVSTNSTLILGEDVPNTQINVSGCILKSGILLVELAEWLKALDSVWGPSVWTQYHSWPATFAQTNKWWKGLPVQLWKPGQKSTREVPQKGLTSSKFWKRSTLRYGSSTSTGVFDGHSYSSNGISRRGITHN